MGWRPAGCWSTSFARNGQRAAHTKTFTHTHIKREIVSRHRYHACRAFSPAGLNAGQVPLPPVVTSYVRTSFGGGRKWGSNVACLHANSWVFPPLAIPTIWANHLHNTDSVIKYMMPSNVWCYRKVCFVAIEHKRIIFSSMPKLPISCSVTLEVIKYHKLITLCPFTVGYIFYNSKLKLKTKYSLDIVSYGKFAWPFVPLRVHWWGRGPWAGGLPSWDDPCPGMWIQE